MSGLFDFLDSSTASNALDTAANYVTAPADENTKPLIPNDLTWGKVFDGAVNITKSVLPALLDSPGATGNGAAYSYKVTPDAKPVNIPVVASIPVENAQTKTSPFLLIGLAVGAFLLIGRD